MKRKALKNVLSMLLVLGMLFTLSACYTADTPQTSQPTESAPVTTTDPTSTVAPTDPVPSVPDRPDLGTKVDPDTPFVPTARYVITSDVHIRMTDNNYESHTRLAQLYQTAYAYSDAQDYNKLDAIFFVGDITNNGTIEEYTYFFDYVNQNTREGTVARALMGNHESFDTGKTTDKSMKEKAPKRFLEQSGYDVMDTTLTIGGNRFIVLAMDQYKEVKKSYYSDEKLEWLKKELDAAVAADSRKPIFLLSHVNASDTVLGSTGKNGDQKLRELLDQYPQVVYFSGHTHSPLTDARSVWQETFTAINTGSLAFLSCAIPDFEEQKDGGAQSVDTLGSWDLKVRVGDRNGVMYWIVETDQYDRVRLQIYNMETQSVWGEPFMIDSLNPTDYKYTDARQETADKPVFADDAKLTLLGLTHKTVAVTIPQAISKDVVQSYRVELYQGDKLLQTDYRLACTFYGDATPETIMASFGALEPSTAYTLKVYAVNSWAKESDALELEFTTKATGDRLEADVLNVSFNEDGTAVNAVTGKNLKAFGAPQISYDEKLGKNVATFDGEDDGYTYEDITAWYPVITKGVSLETYVYLEETDTAAVSWAANLASGGFGFSYRNDSAVFEITTNMKSFTTASTEATTGQWMHLVGTFDGTKLCLYLNGELVSETETQGNLKAAELASQFFAIGADSGPDNQVLEKMFNGKIADVRIYSADISAEQIAELYKNYNN